MTVLATSCLESLSSKFISILSIDPPPLIESYLSFVRSITPKAAFSKSSGNISAIAAVSEALIDVNTGENRILQADIIQDCGNSLNESIDIGQIEGGFIQGLGWLTCEELHFSKDGKLLTTGPSTYKLPGSRDAPPKFKVKLLENADNDEKTIFRSKAVGEPPLLLAISHFLAIKDAIKAANPLSRPEKLNSPATPSEILKVIKA